ncbi:hypothetical protein ECANGB1_2045 [Enterospora canceri]|uniref:Uncharacterized protein n=1 Tax=Enterospora canceri TaxID=1081671 RepID=A0A1Y1S690_9MICR|nr:hypothetical protein ECANGB1_2045 [Enterospora canceri]
MFGLIGILVECGGVGHLCKSNGHIQVLQPLSLEEYTRIKIEKEKERYEKIGGKKKEEEVEESSSSQDEIDEIIKKSEMDLEKMRETGDYLDELVGNGE